MPGRSWPASLRPPGAGRWPRWRNCWASGPADWLIRLSRLGINTYWIVTGLGPVFAEHGPAARENEAEARRRPDAGVVLRDMLRCVPTQDLTEELDRRKGMGGRRPAG